MTIKQLYTLFTDKISIIVASQTKSDSIKELQKLLKDNAKVFEEKDHENTILLIVFVVVGLFAGVILSKMLFQSDVIIILLSIASTLLFFLFAYLLKNVLSYRVPIEVIFVKKIIEKGWKIEYMSPERLWQRYQADHLFLNKGDICDELHCVVHGKTDALYNFTYFDYFYTIEVEEEVQREDSDGEIYYETEYYEESYTESSLFIELENDLPFITINAPLSGIKPMKFSNIQLNHQAKIYTRDIQQAYTFFDPLAQIGLTAFYKRFPKATVEISKSGVFINFCEDLSNVSHTVAFDVLLADRMDSAFLVERIENILHTVCNELMSSFVKSTIIKKKEELQNA